MHHLFVDIYICVRHGMFVPLIVLPFYFIITGTGAEEEGICKVLEAIQHDSEGFLQGERVRIGLCLRYRKLVILC